MTEADWPSSANLSYIESLHDAYVTDPTSVPTQWRAYFKQACNGNGGMSSSCQPSSVRRSIFNPADQTTPAQTGLSSDFAILQDRLDQLVRAYRLRGHLVARIDPLGQIRRKLPELDPTHYGFNASHMDLKFSCRTLYGPDFCTLRQILQRLQNTYCRNIGVQFMHIDQLGVRHWLQERMEGSQNRVALSRNQQLRILTRLTDAVIFEEFIQRKYIGAKRFSLEGSESLIPLLDLALERAAEDDAREVVLGMAHRGRLNVLANIMRKSPKEVFLEFEDSDPARRLGSGDVKYHLGYSSNWTTHAGHMIHLTLCFNPSHLEFVNPVAMGRVRAKQDRRQDMRRERTICVLIHGDAAFAGEGIVQESLNLSELGGYNVGGTLHIIVNNQIGFTTRPNEGRSSLYATGLAKMLQGPIFHVNGEDPEAVAQVVNLAMEFRHTFKRDVVIDMYGYRRHGHNESDEPSFTHPELYERIRNRVGVRDGYLEHLMKFGEVTRDEADHIADQRRQRLEQELSMVRAHAFTAKQQAFGGLWSKYKGGPDEDVEEVDTGVDRMYLSHLLERQTILPESFNLHPKLERFIEARREMATGRRPVDWAAAEALAFASLATQGHCVRLSGQDCGRGTFSHRHAIYHDYRDGHRYIPLQHLDPNQASIEITNSPLSEAAVLGFDYGYSADTPDGLVCWEAQFGDFSNAAQVIIDQFITSAEDKWLRCSGIVLLLPHGFEGQGPEHSSARLERFLTLAADDNIQIINPTTPAQYFHALRRQVIRLWRKPLIVMTPKSLLRHPLVTSSLNELAAKGFQRIITDNDVKPKNVKRILLCTGKVYYDLLAERESRNNQDVALIRLEQLYPLSHELLQDILKPFPNDASLFWVQEEPENMGAWRYIGWKFGEMLRKRGGIKGICRPESASPATGSANSHKIEQHVLVTRAFEEK